MIALFARSAKYVMLALHIVSQNPSLHPNGSKKKLYFDRLLYQFYANTPQHARQHQLQADQKERDVEDLTS
jgi:hypothetical protein